jgi:predicted nucleic acid-binding protein
VMSKQITVIDLSVLINAAIGPDPSRRMRAISTIADLQREFAATRFLQLEVLPIPSKYRKRKELSFYQRFFNQVTTWLDEEPVIQPALDLACQYGLGGMDALHLAAAIRLNAEFISAERPTKPLYQAYQTISSIY